MLFLDPSTLVNKYTTNVQYILEAGYITVKMNVIL